MSAISEASQQKGPDAQKGQSRPGLGLRDSIFISYAHKDQFWCDRIVDLLSADSSIRVWTDQQIKEGAAWDDEIQAKIEDARIALLLISPRFYRSRYIGNTELPQILSRGREKGLVIKWVLVDETPISAIPDDLLAIQAFTVWNEQRKPTSLSAIRNTPLLGPALNRICESLITEMNRFPAVPRQEFLDAVRSVLQGRRYRLEEEVATGDHSVVYRASKPGGMAIVKALVQTPLQDWKGNFEEHLNKAKGLKSRGFIPVNDWSFERSPKLLISEYQDDVRSLESVLKQFRDRGKTLIPIARIRYVLQVLTEALAEYHEAGLVFGNITPSDVLMEQTQLGPSPRISAYRFSQMVSHWERQQCECQFSYRHFTYMAPEQFDDDVVTPATDQYALGLLAIELLQKVPPVQVNKLADLDQKRQFFKDPLSCQGLWQERSPALARVILRMITTNPADRWPTLRDAASELGPPQSIEGQNRAIAKQSYQRIRVKHQAFYAAFYQQLFQSNSSLENSFKRADGTFDWEKQHRSLDSAVCRLLNFTTEESVAEPTSLTDTALLHRTRFRLSPRDMDLFLEAFIATLREFDEGSEAIIEAWRQTLAPGIAYMKKYGSAK